ncbi:hypothetical protein DXG01_000817 [Tephrocybe rancida]|nr:hypothetical protein DXG01_000817 [Tephrocybe rancida]
MSQFTSHSPPPLRHPVPTHPAYIPEPPSTPASPEGYQRFSSSPTPPQSQSQSQGPPSHAYHVPAYSYVPAPHVPSHPHQHQHPPASQYAPPAPSFQIPEAWGVAPGTAQLGFQLGQSAVSAGQTYIAQNFGSVFPSTPLKHHFNVSNAYVLGKLGLVLFPWLQKPATWRRVREPLAHEQDPAKGQAQGQTEYAYAPPRMDRAAPDLYIPLMALVTYILLCALHAGLKGSFHTKVLGEALSRGLAVLLLDVAFVRLGAYFLNVGTVEDGRAAMADLVAYAGYKFVGVIFALVPSFLVSTPLLNTLLFIYAFLANAFFLLRSLRSLVLPDASPTSTLAPPARRRRIVFLFLEASAQVLYMGVLVRI